MNNTLHRSAHAPFYLIIVVVSLVAIGLAHARIDKTLSVHALSDVPASAVTKISALQLINAKTGKKIVDLKDGMVIVMKDIEEMSTPSFNIKAVPSSRDVRSIKFGYNANQEVRIENSAPYAFCGKTKNLIKRTTKYTSCRELGYGSHTIVVTPYSRRYGRGQAGTSTAIAFSILAQSTPGPVAAFSPSSIIFSPAVSPPQGPPVAFPLQVSPVVSPAHGPPATSPLSVPPVASPPQGPSATSPLQVSSPQGPPATSPLQVSPPQGPPAISPSQEARPISSPWNGAPASPVVATTSAPVPIFRTRADEAPPKLINCTLLTESTIDVSSNSSVFAMMLMIQDDVSGFKQGRVTFDGALPQVAFALESTTAGVPVSVKVDVPIPQFTPPGYYQFALSLQDTMQNSVDLNWFELDTLSCPSAIKVKNAIQDQQAPTLVNVRAITSTSVNVSTANASVKFQITAHDDLSGVSHGAVYVIVGKNPVVAKFARNNSTLGQSVTFDVVVSIKRFTASGSYPIEITLFDQVGNSNVFAVSALSAASFPTSVDVYNSILDNSAPQLLNFAVRSLLPVDVSVTNATIVFALRVQDDISGVASGSLSLTQGREFISTTFSLESQTAGESLEVNIQFPIKRYLKQGNYEIEVTLSDAIGNTIVYYGSTLAAKGFASTVQIVHLIPDTSAPTLVAFNAMSPMTVDVTTKPQKVDLQIVIQDNLSGFSRGKVTVNTPVKGDENGLRYDISRVDYPVIGEPVAVYLSLYVPSFTLPGMYPIQITLGDGSGNEVTWSSTALADRSFPSVVQVISNPDLTAPRLLEFSAVSSATADITSGTTFVEFDVVAQDDGTGLSRVEIYMYLPDGTTEFFGNAVDRPVAGEATKLRVAATIRKTLQPGFYPLVLGMKDYVMNEEYYTTGQLRSLGFPSAIEVVSRYVDNIPPLLLNFSPLAVFLDSTGTGTPSFQFIVDVKDEGIGFSHGKLTIYKTGLFEGVISSATFKPTRVDEGGGSSVVRLSERMVFDRVVPSGTYPYRIELVDHKDNTVKIDAVDLQLRGFISNITIF